MGTKFAEINSTVHTFNEFECFKNITGLPNYNGFVLVREVKFPPYFETWNDDQPYTINVITYDLPETVTRFHLSRGGINKPELVLILRGSIPPSFSFGYFRPNTSNCHIYVPDDAIDTYKATSPFSDYQNCILPLSEYNP